MEQNLEKLEQSIRTLSEKQNRLYFFVQDTKGNAKASVRYIYQMAYALKQGGYNPIILHEKNEYAGVAAWLGTKYMDELPHKSIDNQNLEVSPEDFIIIPEIFAFVMEQIKNLPCGKIVLSQAYDHIFETLQPGQTWNQFGFVKCITTSETQKDYISNVMRNTSVDVISPIITETFEKQKLPAKPIIAIHSREQRDTLNLIKSFYVKFPQYRWITFRDMRSLTEYEFANILSDCFLSVWIDETSSFGTYPLESMKVGVPVIGIQPNMKPEWLDESNGIWINNKLNLVDFVADFVQNWLEDNINDELYTKMEETANKYTNVDEFNTKVISLFEHYNNTRLTAFTEQLNKLKTN